MQSALDRVTAGETKRVIMQIPIRHGKTEHSTIGFGGYQLERVQKTRLLVGSYNDRQAQKLSRGIRKLARARGVVVSPEKDTASEWETVLGGGVRAVGAGAGVASVNADGILDRRSVRLAAGGRVRGTARPGVRLVHERHPRALRAAHVGHPLDVALA
jgi:hypothetical protein